MRGYERASTLLVSNRPVEDWGKLLVDTAAVTAMLDRLLHHARRPRVIGVRRAVSRFGEGPTKPWIRCATSTCCRPSSALLCPAGREPAPRALDLPELRRGPARHDQPPGTHLEAGAAVRGPSLSDDVPDAAHVRDADAGRWRGHRLGGEAARALIEPYAE